MTSLLAGAAIVIGCCAAAFFGTLGLAFIGRLAAARIHQEWERLNVR